ncbi:MAG: response regulator [Alphaproteobacteria bacterium]|jgi:two-component system cell cycle response regulator DivK|nr:response regulator [Alphaproteobacteria bacterium]MDP6567259.1 response regulator [Alphaproteobacteria bacterium]MDP6811689.1 response regulator [Alphaproteobacteria bacterium]|tara:strand:- start:80 stop:445 length:366 start_codon:yes stop_codon:yes gene_type:complete
MSKRVLVVEDQEDNRQIMEDMLTNAGYQVFKAKTGDEGVALAEAQVPDLILMDIMLPGIDGYEATRRIKAQAALARIPIIAVTSYAMQGEEDRAMAAGCDAYFGKPVSPRVLLAKIQDFIG